MTELDLKFAAKALKSAEAASGVAMLDVAPVNSAAARALYKKREPIYPKLVHGRFRALKWFLLALTLGVYYLLPWVRWPRGPAEPDQAALVDFAGGRFYFFFIEIWPSELYYVTGLLILAALALFLATALFGRVWCGYACPQTVWTDLFIAAERLIEGDRNARIKLAKAPWTADKILRKSAKHAIWLLIAAATGGAWILYFHDAPTIAAEFFEGCAFDLAHALLGNAQARAERFERDRLVVNKPALANDEAFAFVEVAHGVGHQIGARGAVMGLHHHRLGAFGIVGE